MSRPRDRPSPWSRASTRPRSLSRTSTRRLARPFVPPPLPPGAGGEVSHPPPLSSGTASLRRPRSLPATPTTRGASTRPATSCPTAPAATSTRATSGSRTRGLRANACRLTLALLALNPIAATPRSSPSSSEGAGLAAPPTRARDESFQEWALDIVGLVFKVAKVAQAGGRTSRSSLSTRGCPPSTCVRCRAWLGSSTAC